MIAIRSFTLFSSQGGAPSQEDYVIGKQDRGVFAVADGFGGSGPGARASKTACESVVHFLEREAGDLEATLPFVLRSYFSLAGNVLFNALIHANQEVLSLNKKKSMNEKGGASMVAAFLDEGLFALANIGSCSAWLIRGGSAREIVTPRSYARLSDPFAVDPAPEQSAPLMAMGVSEDIEPEIFEFKVNEGDWVLLHTDGLRAMVREALTELQLDPRSDVEAVLKAMTYEENASCALIKF